MELLVTYDVGTTDREGQRRLRRVAKVCEGIGHRVQQSVFEVVCDPPERLRLEAKLRDIIDPRHDSVRIYRLEHGTFRTVRHIGASLEPPHHGSVII